MWKQAVVVCSMLSMFILTNLMTTQINPRISASFIPLKGAAPANDLADAAKLLPKLNVYFMKGDAKLRPSLQLARYISNLSDFLTRYPNKTIFLTGYAGTNEYNKDPLQLSENRARAVKKYLVKKGFSTNHIIVKAKGAPSVSSLKTTAGAGQKNQKVEVRIY